MQILTGYFSPMISIITRSLYRSALGKLSENVYITIDLDVFDPSLMPSTGTPEPGGPDYFEIMHFLRDVAQDEKCGRIRCC